MRTLNTISKAITVFCSVLILFAFTGERPVRIYLIGDSTMADKPLIGTAERGWGQALPLFFDGDVLVENHARNGRSTKSFLAEGRWQSVLDKLQADDIVFIQFGHNDEKKGDTSRFADARTDYKKNLVRFITEAKARGAAPVLLTPVSRRKFDDHGTLVDTHGDYPVVVREVAAEQHVPLIDAHKRTMQWLESLGPEKSKKFFVWIRPGLYTANREGRQDNTHFNEPGALAVAGMVAEDLRGLDLPCSRHLRQVDASSTPGVGKTVCLDQFYNNEWKKDAKGQPARYHYVWSDTANSGFSYLGSMIVNLGASIDTINGEPAAESLKRASIYIIVDPDTPLETEHPNYMGTKAVDEIEQWVKAGGVLVLMENDKGNSEFEHFNKLPERFGIRFNEDSRNKVTGTDYDMGKFDVFPEHPIFKGVRKIYMKEVSTIQVHDPAKALLTEKGDVIIASAKVGQGFVFAVGDPWLYNEYITHRKLPDSFENEKAAENLFRWLLQMAKPVED
jgi:lysophospholipase L1-like esterase